MRPALDVIWDTLRDWYYSLLGLAALNLLWLALSLTVILLPPATAGLYVVTNSLARGTGARLEDYTAGARRYARLSYQWALVNVIVIVVFAANFTFYSATDSVAGVVIQSIWTALGLLWIAMQFYLWPFLIEQEDKRFRAGLKNALFLTLANPLYTALLLGVAGLAIVVSLLTILPLAIFTTSFISLLGNRAVIERLKAYDKFSITRS